MVPASAAGGFRVQKTAVPARLCRLLPCLSTLAQSAAPAVLVERNVAMKTRDGVTLHADIYRPAADGTYPVLLTRTPYDKNNSADFGRMGALRGFMVVVQDVRGRYTSEGEWYPFKHEINDGYDTVEWAAALPHSNGKVGMFSGSYVGATQMLAAISHPPHLAGICPIVTASNYHENWTYQGGAFEQWFNESWTSGLAQDTLNRVIRERTNARVGDTVLPLEQYPVFNIDRGLTGTELTRALAPYFLDWLAHPNYDDYWKQWSIEENYAEHPGPRAHRRRLVRPLSGRLIAQLHGPQGARRQRGRPQWTASDRRHRRPLRHRAARSAKSTLAPTHAFDENAVTLDWYDYLFKGKQNEFANGKPVQHLRHGRKQVAR